MNLLIASFIIFLSSPSNSQELTNCNPEFFIQNPSIQEFDITGSLLQGVLAIKRMEFLAETQKLRYVKDDFQKTYYSYIRSNTPKGVNIYINSCGFKEELEVSLQESCVQDFNKNDTRCKLVCIYNNSLDPDCDM